MTLPASFPLSLSQIATELGLALPLSLNHAWVEALAGVSGLPLSFSQLLGKTGRFDGSLLPQNIGSPFFEWDLNFSNAPFFGAQMNTLSWTSSGTGQVFLGPFNTASTWTGNVIVKNNTTGISQVLTPVGNPLGKEWFASSAPTNFMRLGFTDSFTILPSN
jgi:hypothetical protein